MPDFSDTTARYPQNSPFAGSFDKTHDQATDRDAATPTEWAGAHAEKVYNEVKAIADDLISIAGLYVYDNGGIDIGWTAGRVQFGPEGAPVDVAASTLSLTDDDTNYVEVNSAGTVSANVVGFTEGSFHMATVVTSGGDISTLTDDRSAWYMAQAGDYVLDDIGDVTITGVADNEVLAYDDGTSEWINQTPTEANLLQKDGGNDLLKLVFDAATELTISTGAVTATQTYHRIDTEGDAASDDLDTINGGSNEQILIIRPENDARTVVLKDGTGNLELHGTDVTLDTADKCVALIYDSTLTKWVLIDRPEPVAAAHTHDGDTLQFDGINSDGGAFLFLTTGKVSFNQDVSLGDKDLLDVLEMRMQTSTELTIAAGVVTMTQGWHTIDTQADGATDDLDTISGGNDGAHLYIRAEHADRTVVLKHGTGNLELSGTDISLDDTDQVVHFIYDATLTKWVAIHGGDLADFATRALDNLAAVAINTSLISDGDDTDDLGSAAIGWKYLYMSDATGEAPSTNGQMNYYATNTRFEFYQNGGVWGLGGDYATIYVDAAAMVPTAPSGPTEHTEEYAVNGIWVDQLHFDDAAEESAQFKLVMPEDWDRGTVKIKVYWDPDDGNPGDGVVWGLRGLSVSDDDPIDAALGVEQTIADVVLAVGDLHVTGATPAITLAGAPALGDMQWFQIARKVADGADDLADDAMLFGVLIQYKKLTTQPVAW